ncbi:Uncharacterised protein [uncultured archaeon]|nr:Uncharacterised protein [uncultured archaeon]
MPKKLSYSSIARIVFIIILATIISGCDSPENYVVVPTNDVTPPTVGMSISQENNNTLISVNETSQPVTMHAVSNVVTFISGASDNDGGIKEVSLWATVTYYKPGQIVGPGLVGAPIKNDVSNASVGESTLKNRFFLYNYDLKQERGSWSSIKVDAWTEGKNFYGGITRTPVVSIYYP